MSLLRSALTIYNIPFPCFNYSCSRLISQKVWPGITYYDLYSLATIFNCDIDYYDSERHANTVAQIIVNACDKTGVSSIPQLTQDIEIFDGRIFPGGYVPARINKRSYQKSNARDIVRTVTEFDHEHPFFGSTLVFTGTLHSMKRKDAMQKAVDVGGICCDRITELTNFLVVGEQDIRQAKYGTKSSKMVRVEQLNKAGNNIEIISESEFLKLL